jgi:hypothetical protein
VAAEVLNDFFLNLAENLKSQIGNSVSPINLLKTICPTNFPHMVTNPVTKGEILSTISSLKSKNSSGCDGISKKY